MESIADAKRLLLTEEASPASRRRTALEMWTTVRRPRRAGGPIVGHRRFAEVVFVDRTVEDQVDALRSMICGQRLEQVFALELGPHSARRLAGLLGDVRRSRR